MMHDAHVRCTYYPLVWVHLIQTTIDIAEMI